MPHKFNADRRAKIPKQKRRVTNCAEYDESLRRRGDLTVSISEDALAVWSAPRRTTPGGQPVYSDVAVELCLTLRMVFKQPLRQAQGLMRAISKLMEVDITVPHFTTMSRRDNGLSFLLRLGPSFGYHARHLGDAQTLRRQDTPMTRDQSAVRINQNRHRPTPLLDGRRKLVHLLVTVRSAVTRKNTKFDTFFRTILSAGH